MSGKQKGSVFKEGDSWYHRVKVLKEDGTVKYSKRGGYKTAAEAEKGYRRYEEEFKKSYRAYQMMRSPDMEIGLKDYLIYWFEELYSPRVENTTRMVAAYTLYNMLIPNMENDIKLKYVHAGYLDNLLEQVAKITESAGNKGRELLNQALKEAVIQGCLTNNPAESTKTYPRKKPHVIILSKDKIKVLLKAASRDNWYLEILCALFCGLRKGEIYGMKFSDFDLVEKTVRIERQITSNPIVKKGTSSIESYQVIEKEPKTMNSYRKLRIPDVVAEEVRKRKEKQQEKKAGLGDGYIDLGYVSCQENGLPHAVSAFNTALTKLCQRSGLPHITVHGLRHMYATILVEQGVPLIKISALLGHSSVNTTFEYYCEVIDENDRILSFMNDNFRPEGRNGDAG